MQVSISNVLVVVLQVRKTAVYITELADCPKFFKQKVRMKTHKHKN